jgi:hypothetical protein
VTQQAQQTPSTQQQESLEFARRLYESITSWYKETHGRAQIVLTVDGAFVTLLAGTIVGKPADMGATTSVFGPETWGALLLMALAFAVSGGCAIWALIPLRLSSKKIEDDFRALLETDRAKQRDPPSSVMWYSQFIVRVRSEDFIDWVSRIDLEDERNALAQEIHILSHRLTHKYQGVFAAYAATGVALLMLLIAAADYAVRA